MWGRGRARPQWGRCRGRGLGGGAGGGGVGAGAGGWCRGRVPLSQIAPHVRASWTPPVTGPLARLGLRKETGGPHHRRPSTRAARHKGGRCRNRRGPRPRDLRSFPTGSRGPCHRAHGAWKRRSRGGCGRPQGGDRDARTARIPKPVLSPSKLSEVLLGTPAQRRKGKICL